ncbi:non-ribosomal peptide synthetase [Actinomadura sp. DC4]|uniref:non-ribosomal peptide synthetase n=1 Tax=Actinomadura sp. DC4 TaxID=3055069 RepID=UPI0025AFE55F|nr:non-ribosomal peptide synthetase [Actinomadura sp. DC4]MDN3356432.1 amino acid adenylation domain-containing protein [Actinomadura sp. DC4]
MVMEDGSTQARLLSRIRHHRSRGLPVRDPEMPVPLSSAQRGLWFLDQLEPGRGDYVVPIALRLSGVVDVAALEEALSRLVARHEVLRTRFVADEAGQPYQVIDPPSPAVVEVGDVDEAMLTARVNAVAATPFDLANGPMLRTTLLRTSPAEAVLVICLHHIVFDGWSEAVFARELTALYTAATGGAPATLPALPAQYGDHAAWQDGQLDGERFQGHLDYWRTRLAGLQPLQLPTDRPRGPVRGGHGDAVTFDVPAGTVTALRGVATGLNASLFMVLTAAFQVMLSRYTGQTDIAVGTPVAGRNHSETEDLIGLFVNSLVLRTDLSGDPTFTELVERVRETALGAYDHQDLPFERLVEELAPQRDLSRNPLFQAVLVLQTSAETEPWRLPGLTVEPAPVTGGLAKFDLNLSLSEVGDGLTGHFDYPTDLFDTTTVERMTGHFRTLLEQLAGRPAAPLSEIRMLTEAERERILLDWNDTDGPFPEGRTMHGLVADQAAATPGSPAVICGDRVLTHGELDVRSNRLAHYLRARGVGPDVLVAVFLDRSPDLIVALLAIQKAGGAFVPLDPEYPVERLAYMLEDTAAPLVITQTGLAGLLPDGTARLLVDEQWPAVEECPATDPEPLAGPRDLAYVIYTSGSTGKPKGVMIEHEGAVNYLHWCDQAYPPVGDAGTLLYSPVAFDLTITALFLPLMQGMPVVVPVPQPGESAFAASVEQLLSGLSVSFLKMTPSHAELLVTSAETTGTSLNVNTMVLGGEELTAELARRILAVCEDTVIYNEYGATECSVANVMSATREVGADASGGVSVGSPITNTTAYVVDAGGEPVPVGVAGECLLGGICVARGYLNRPELTSKRFVWSDLGKGRQRLYRTGDLCRWLPNGELEFIGRIDTQVKLRGYRIELGEIEATLIDHPDVASAAVIVREDTPGVQRLTAYLVPGATEPSTEDLRTRLARTLPSYMVPAAFVTLPALPLTPNGKTDRDALPAPATAARETTPPSTDTEHLIAGIWSDILGTTDPGIHDNFFDLGGHSLLAIKVTSRLRRELGIEVPLRALFQAPTIAGLSELLPGMHTTDQEDRPAPRDPEMPVPLSSAQRGLWFLDQLEPGRGDYVVPIALRLSGVVDVAALEEALSRLVARHEVLRTRFVADEAGQPYQVIDPPSPAVVEVGDVDEAMLTARVNAVAATPFDLANGPMLRTTLLRTSPAEAVLVICLHHIVFDGWSEAIFARELRELYAAATGDNATEPPALPVQYGDFAAWQRRRLAGGRLQAQLDYWRTRLAGLQPLHLPTDRPRRPARSTRGDAVTFSVPATTVTALRAIAADANASLFMALLAGFQVLLSRYSGQDDIAVGTPIAGRGHGETENLIGLFVNSLVLRTDLSGDPTFGDLLHRVKDTALGAYDHQDLPFERLVEELAPQRDLSRNPLFQAVMVLQTSAETQPWHLSGLTVEPAPAAGGLAKFDLNLSLHEVGDGLTGTFDYPTDLFDTTTVERMTGHFRTLLGHLAGDPTTPVSGIAMLTGAERDALTEWGTAVRLPAEVGDVPAAPVRVVDRHGRPVPVGVPGELVLDGATPRHTGDLVRWSPSGELSYVGRGEDQVVVHGDRVALGEVEAALAEHDAVAGAAAAVREEDLVGYVVPAGPAAPEAGELRQFLSERLPGFMVPAAYVTLPELPRTITGAVDRQALPTPGEGPASAPHSAAEKIIADIWREILGVPDIGVTDNFFALGGDSIISLQVIARAKKFGIQLTPRVFFQHQTVAAIAANAQSTGAILADQAKLVGEVPLTPIQHWFFELGLSDPAHFNQEELLETDGLDGTVLRRALLALVDHHDALRLRIEEDGGRWRQRLDGDAGPGILTCHDLSALDEDEVRPRMARIADEAQHGMDLAGGPVIRAALVDLGRGRGQRLLIVVHHLAVDGVSWRILLEDLGTAYRQAADGRAPLLPAKTTSVRTWADKLVRHARSAEALAELDYWASQGARRPLPRDHDGENTMRSSAAVTAALSEDETTALLQDVPKAFHTQINDALLAAVGASVHTWTGDDAVCVSLEGHGREDLFADVDTSRTVGWFTSLFPLTLHGMAQADPVIRLKDVGEQLRGIPRRGIGYGILRHLGDPAVRQALDHGSPEINFNYLGQFTPDVTGLGRYAGADEPRGRSIGPAGMRRNVLDILAAVEHGRLSIEFSYSTALHDARTVERVAENVMSNLRSLLGLAAEQNEGIGAGPTHLPLAELNEDEMAAIMRRFSA